MSEFGPPPRYLSPDDGAGGGSGAPRQPERTPEEIEREQWQAEIESIREQMERRWGQWTEGELRVSVDERIRSRKERLKSALRRVDNIRERAKTAASSSFTLKELHAILEYAHNTTKPAVETHVIPLIPEATYLILQAQIMRLGISPKKAAVIAGVLNGFISKRLIEKAQAGVDAVDQALGQLEQVVQSLRQHGEALEVKNELQEAIDQARAERVVAESDDGSEIVTDPIATGGSAATSPAGGTSVGLSLDVARALAVETEPEAPPAAAAGNAGGGDGAEGGGPPRDPSEPDPGAERDDDGDDENGGGPGQRRIHEADMQAVFEGLRERDKMKAEFAALVDGVEYTDEYYEQKIDELRRLAAGGALEDEPAAMVSKFLESDRRGDFILNGWEELIGSMGHARNNTERDGLIRVFQKKLERHRDSGKYKPDAVTILIGYLHQNRDALKAVMGRRSNMGIDGLLYTINYEASSIILRPEDTELLNNLRTVNSALRHLADLEMRVMVERGIGSSPESRKLAWDILVGEIDSLMDRIMSSRVVAQNEQFRMSYQEETVVNTLQNVIRNLGNEISEYFRQRDGESKPEFTHVAIIKGKSLSITYDGSTTLGIKDIDVDYEGSERVRTIGSAFEMVLANRVALQKEKVRIMHNILHSITQGAGIESIKESARQLPTEFVQRLYLSNPEYALAENVYLTALSEAIAANNYTIPSTFGIRNDEGYDEIEEAALENLLSLLPRREGETPVQHRNRCRQALSAGEVIAYVNGDALALLKRALPRQNMKDNEDGDVDVSVAGEQTHSKSYWALGPKLIPFFFHHLYLAPSNMPWLPFVYIPKDLDAYVVGGGRDSERFSPEDVIRWRKVMLNARKYGASEEMLRDFMPRFELITEVEDPEQLGTTEGGKMGNYDAWIVKKVDAAGHETADDDVPATISNLRMLGSGYVFSYVTSDAKFAWLANPENYSPDESRLRDRPKTLRQLQNEYARAKKAFDDITKKHISNPRMSNAVLQHKVRYEAAKEALQTRIVELEVTMPMRDAMPSAMVTAEKFNMTHDYEVERGYALRQSMIDALKDHPLVRRARSEQEHDHQQVSLFDKYIETQLARTMLNVQYTLERRFIEQRRAAYDQLVAEDKEEEARALFGSGNYVFNMREALAEEGTQRIVADMFRRLQATSRGGIGIGDIIGSPEEFQAFVLDYSDQLQLQIGDMHPEVAAVVDPDAAADGRIGITRYELYGEQGGFSSSHFIREKRRLTFRLKNENDPTRKARIQDRIRAIDDKLDDWVDTQRALARERRAPALVGDSLAQRAAKQLLGKYQSARTELFVRDKAADRTNFTKYGANFYEKAVNNAVTESNMVEKSTKLWLEKLSDFVRSAKSGVDGLKGALGSIKGSLDEVAELWDGKDDTRAPMEILKRILLIERFVGLGPEARKAFSSSETHAAIQRKPLTLMQMAIPPSPDRDVVALDTDDIGFCSTYLATEVSKAKISPYRRRFGRADRTITVGSSDRQSAKLGRVIAGRIERAPDITQRAADAVFTLGTRLESTRFGGKLGELVKKDGELLQRIAGALPERTNVISEKVRRFFSGLQKPNEREIVVSEYVDQAASLEMIRRVQGVNWRDRAVVKERLLMWLFEAGMGVLTFFAWLYAKSKEK